MDDQLRKVIILTDVPIGPYYHYCSQLANSLVQHNDIEVRMLALFMDTRRMQLIDEEAFFLTSGLKMEVLDSGKGSKFRRLIDFVYAVSRLWWSLLKSTNVIVHIHTHTGMPLFDICLVLAIRVSGTHIVRTVHELTAEERFGKETPMQRRVAGLLLKWVNQIIVHDRHTRDRLIKNNFLDSDRISVIPHGNYLVFRSFAPVSMRAAGQLLDGPPVILFHGVKRNKGIEIFVKAIELMLERKISFRVLITGQVSSGDEDILKKVKSMENVQLETQYISSNKLWSIYEQADIVAMPYLRGTTSGAVHLAFAFERPVISSDLHCFDNLVINGKTGMVIPRDDASALTDGLEMMIKDRVNLNQMGKAGYGLTSSKAFNWDEIAHSTISSYKSAL